MFAQEIISQTTPTDLWDNDEQLATGDEFLDELSAWAQREDFRALREDVGRMASRVFVTELDGMGEF